jgi:serine/threonine-protein kinase
MGEVYRADDLELNQPVALKFLPGRVQAHPAELDQLRREVRVAREIAHPNVCRTYDIASVDGHAFLVMEYIAGEDLASVLRRLGRPSRDKAIEIARQLCLGLGAAHERGILHRDLKPANVMIDDRGRVRITDFGLAGLEESQGPDGGGTPAYMAPEQLAGGAASLQSDLYSLGLVLYEVFTGKRAYEERGAAHKDSSPRSPSTLTPDIDPAVERVILRCLESDPQSRPKSAYAVLGALPGGDPLAAALAAGETPSPELVANAGVEGSLHPGIAIACVVLAIASLVGLAAVDRNRYAAFHRSDAELNVRSGEIVAKAGIAKPKYSYGGFMENTIYFARVERRDSSALAYSAAHPEPSAGILYWRRWSPTPLIHPDMHNTSPNFLEPIPGPGSVMALMDPDGRLVHLSTTPTMSDQPSEATGGDAEPCRRLVRLRERRRLRCRPNDCRGP